MLVWSVGCSLRCIAWQPRITAEASETAVSSPTANRLFEFAKGFFFAEVRIFFYP